MAKIANREKLAAPDYGAVRSPEQLGKIFRATRKAEGMTLYDIHASSGLSMRFLSEFEALHPFEDGNGRVGRMLITLMLWRGGAISAPHFYISRYFEDHKEEYITRLRDVSAEGDWIGWCGFFLEAVRQQAIHNLSVAHDIRECYEDMKLRLADLLASKYSVSALDYLFTNPIFSNSRFTSEAGIPTATAGRFTRALLNEGLLETVREASGRRPAIYRFEPLMEKVRV